MWGTLLKIFCSSSHLKIKWNIQISFLCIWSSELRKPRSWRSQNWLSPQNINEKTTLYRNAICQKKWRYDHFLNWTKWIQRIEAKVLHLLGNFEKVSKRWNKRGKDSESLGRFFDKDEHKWISSIHAGIITGKYCYSGTFSYFDWNALRKITKEQSCIKRQIKWWKKRRLTHVEFFGRVKYYRKSSSRLHPGFKPNKFYSDKPLHNGKLDYCQRVQVNRIWDFTQQVLSQDQVD